MDTVRSRGRILKINDPGRLTDRRNHLLILIKQIFGRPVRTKWYIRAGRDLLLNGMEQFKNTIEAEIAELTKQIEAKRSILESERGIVEEKDAVRQVVGEKISEAVPSFVPKAVSTKDDDNKSYLDSADEDTTNIINGLLEKVFSEGIATAIKYAEMNDPYIIDAFHDALTDKMYEKLKAEGIVK